MAKKKKNKSPSKMGKLWKFVSTAAGVSGFVSGVVKNDIASSTTFAGRDIEGKLQHIADVFLGRTIGFSPFGIATKTRKLKPFGWLNTSTLGAGFTLLVHTVLKQAPSFPFKAKIQGGLKNGVFPFLLFQGIGAIFDPPPASPAGTGRIVSRVVEIERGLN
jgi:hypothetical protein